MTESRLITLDRYLILDAMGYTLKPFVIRLAPHPSYSTTFHALSSDYRNQVDTINTN